MMEMHSTIQAGGQTIGELHVRACSISMVLSGRRHKDARWEESTELMAALVADLDNRREQRQEGRDFPAYLLEHVALGNSVNSMIPGGYRPARY